MAHQELQTQIDRVRNEVLPNYDGIVPHGSPLHAKACSEAAIRMRVDLDRAEYLLKYGSDSSMADMVQVLKKHD